MRGSISRRNVLLVPHLFALEHGHRYCFAHRVKPQDPPAEPTPDLQLEIAHLLLIDVVGYSKLLVNEQIELLQELKQIVRAPNVFALRKQGANSSEYRPEMGWRCFSSIVWKNRCGVRSRLAEHCKTI